MAKLKKFLGVDELADDGQDADALVEPVEPEDRGNRAGHHSHLSRKLLAWEEHPVKLSSQLPGESEKKSLASVT